MSAKIQYSQIKSLHSSVQSPVSNRPYSDDTSGSRRTSSGVSLPSVTSQRPRLERKSIQESPEAEDRRISFPFPVTSWISRQKQQRALKGSHSQSEIDTGILKKDKPDISWRVALLVSKAKRKFSGEVFKNRADIQKIHRRISLNDFFRVAMMKRSDSEKKKMIRDLKIKALVHKVILNYLLVLSTFNFLVKFHVYLL